MFKTPFNVKNFVTGEDYSKTPSITQPEQVLPLRKILDGLANGTIYLDDRNLSYDISEHEIDVANGKTPEQTNANIAAATAADLAESADKFGEDVTAHPSFQIEDAQPTIDAVEAVIAANAERDGEQAAALQSQAADKPNGEALTANPADNS